MLRFLLALTLLGALAAPAGSDASSPSPRTSLACPTCSLLGKCTEMRCLPSNDSCLLLQRHLENGTLIRNGSCVAADECPKGAHILTYGPHSWISKGCCESNCSKAVYPEAEPEAQPNGVKCPYCSWKKAALCDSSLVLNCTGKQTICATLNGSWHGGEVALQELVCRSHTQILKGCATPEICHLPANATLGPLASGFHLSTQPECSVAPSTQPDHLATSAYMEATETSTAATETHTEAPKTHTPTGSHTRSTEKHTKETESPMLTTPRTKVTETHSQTAATHSKATETHRTTGSHSKATEKHIKKIKPSKVTASHPNVTESQTRATENHAQTVVTPSKATVMPDKTSITSCFTCSDTDHCVPLRCSEDTNYCLQNTGITVLGKQHRVSWRNGSCVAAHHCKFENAISAFTSGFDYGFWVNTTCCQGNCQMPPLFDVLPASQSLSKFLCPTCPDDSPGPCNSPLYVQCPHGETECIQLDLVHEDGWNLTLRGCGSHDLCVPQARTQGLPKLPTHLGYWLAHPPHCSGRPRAVLDNSGNSVVARSHLLFLPALVIALATRAFS